MPPPATCDRAQHIPLAWVQILDRGIVVVARVLVATEVPEHHLGGPGRQPHAALIRRDPSIGSKVISSAVR